MLVYGGIDEAGYGPMFGPLCVGASVFVLPEYDPSEGAPDMWSIMDNIVCKTRRDAKHRIAINDSKKLKSGHPPKGLLHLERGVLTFLSAIHRASHDSMDGWTDGDFFNAISCNTPDAPWAEEPTPLPVAFDPQVLRIDAAGVRRGLEQVNVQCNMLTCTSIDATTYNQRTEIESKAALNFSVAMQLVDAIVGKWPDEHPRIMIDRHGGKIRYRNDLQLCWPDAHIQILTENPSMSRYRLQVNGSLFTLTFASKSDEKHLPVALASMVAKYTRELQMIRFNRFFTGLIPELKPTAGYVQDGRRFLNEIGPLLAEKGINQDLLVRTS